MEEKDKNFGREESETQEVDEVEKPSYQENIDPTEELSAPSFTNQNGTNNTDLHEDANPNAKKIFSMYLLK